MRVLATAAIIAVGVFSASVAQAESVLSDILSGGVLKVGNHRRLEPDDHERPGHQHLQRL